MEKLLTQEALALLLNRIPMGIILIDGEFRVVFWNSVIEEWTARSAEEVAGKDLRQLYPHLAQEKYELRIRSVLEAGPPMVFSAQLHGSLIPTKTPFGKERTQNATVLNIHQGNGADSWAIIAIQDVTDLNDKIFNLRKIKDEAVREKNLAQMYLDIAGVIILELDAGMNIRILNRKGCETLGVAEQEVIGANWLERFVPGPERLAARKTFQQMLRKENEPNSYRESTVLDCHGNEKTIAWRDSQVRDMEGRITGILSSGEDITEKKKMMDLLVKKSITDPLTGLYNRGYFFETIRNEIRFAKRNHQDFVTAIVDIDHFKTVNDTWGHLAGDAVLRAFGETVRKSIRDYDLLARYGGEEFIIFFKDTIGEVALRVMERLRENVLRMDVPSGNDTLHVTFSAGLTAIAEFADHRETGIDEILQVTDMRLYHAKLTGRNRIVSNRELPLECLDPEKRGF
jgi:diguanylate cyclase (GGDEF)-like protein/PAS domain S-box-containing protein